MTRHLEGELQAVGRATTTIHFKMLESLGVDRGFACDLWRNGYGFGVQHCRDAGGGFYEPDEGPLHLILPVYEDGALVDLCAFRSANPDGWLLRTGNGWAQGLERGLEPHSWEPALLWSTPLDWLRAGGRGLCVLDWGAGEVRLLRELPAIICQNPILESRLRSALSKPPRLPTISSQKGVALAA